jgi:hypothetical protein
MTFKGYLLIFSVLATQAIANVVKSSFGPSGLDKMMVDDIGVRPSKPQNHPHQILTSSRMSQSQMMVQLS